MHRWEIVNSKVSKHRLSPSRWSQFLLAFFLFSCLSLMCPGCNGGSSDHAPTYKKRAEQTLLPRASLPSQETPISERLASTRIKTQATTGTKIHSTSFVAKSGKEWKRILSPLQYRIIRQKGTERPFSGKYNKFNGRGIFVCAACGKALFRSVDKYDSRTGWPSFIRSSPANNVGEKIDSSYGMNRTEVYCRQCGGHLGHVFADGPAPTGQRYCINSASLRFVPKVN